MAKTVVSGLIFLLLLSIASALVLNGEHATISGSNADMLSSSVTVAQQRILVDGLPYEMKGVGYAPTPIGVDPEVTPPYGDYFTSDYSSIYMRDLPLLRQMGVNTIRLWGWNNNANHTDFLNRAYNNGVNPIRVIVTFWMDISAYPDISSQVARTQIITAFRNMVALNKDNSAVLMWSIGNELNVPWEYGNNLDNLFSLINEMAQAAHAAEGATAHPVTTPLADVNLLNTISNYDKAMTNLDVWSIQVFRGITFGSLLADLADLSSKPLAITEYGIDAYDNNNHVEYENIGQPYQAIYAQALWNEIASNSNICVGGSIMAYSDEWWKGKHGTSPDYDPSYHSESGYSTNAHPDGFSNEEWWGIMRTVDNGSYPDIMEPRAAYYALQTLWFSTSPTPTPTPTTSPTPIPTPTPTSTPTATPTASPSPSPSQSPNPTPTPIPTLTPTPTPTPSPIPTATPTPTTTPTVSPAPSPAPTPTPSPSPTSTPTPTSSPTAPPTPTPTASLSPSSTANLTPTPIVPELSWLVILPLFVSMVLIAVKLRHRKTTTLSRTS